jgi:hypothetical protein
MVRAVFFIEQIAIGLYILCGLGILLTLRGYMSARQQLNGAQFELEKELARFRERNASTLMLVVIEVGLAVFAIAQIVAPTLREQPPQTIAIVSGAVDVPFVTAAPNALLGGTPPPNFAEGVEIPGIEDELNLQPFATPTLTPTPVGTIIPDVPAAVGCDTDAASLRVPANGMVIPETTTIIGNATTDNFAFYRFELNGPSTNNVWAILSEYTIPVVDGELGQIVPALLTPGEHRFRLMVFDITNTLQASCMMTIFISPPIPTATPIRES